MKKQIPLLWLFILLPLCPKVHATAVVFVGEQGGTLRPAEGVAQQARILWREGMEYMTTSVVFQANVYEQAVWILSLPAKPRDRIIETAIEHDCGEMRFEGVETKDALEDTIEHLMLTARSSQIYPWFIEGLYLNLTRARRLLVRCGTHHALKLEPEVVQPKSLDVLRLHLQQRGVGVARSDLKTFQPYVSKGYVLVIAKVPAVVANQAGRVAVMEIVFPTDLAYCPLILGGQTGDRSPNDSLDIVGHVNPRVAPAARVPLHTAYMEHVRSYGYDVGNGKQLGGRFPYTRFTCREREPGANCDLWFTPSHSLDLKYARFLVASLSEKRNVTFAAILLTVCLSYISGGVAGVMTYGRWRPYCLLGLCNVLTILGVLIAVSFLRSSGDAEHVEHAVPPTTKPNMVTEFLLRFSLLFVGFTAIAQILLTLPCWSLGR